MQILHLNADTHNGYGTTPLSLSIRRWGSSYKTWAQDGRISFGTSIKQDVDTKCTPRLLWGNFDHCICSFSAKHFLSTQGTYFLIQCCCFFVAACIVPVGCCKGVVGLFHCVGLWKSITKYNCEKNETWALLCTVCDMIWKASLGKAGP